MPLITEGYNSYELFQCIYDIEFCASLLLICSN